MTRACLLGYDPGGDNSHGLALSEVAKVGGRWTPQALQTATVGTVREAVAWVEAKTAETRILAVGLDTLTEWNSGSAGWRPADLWLRSRYPAVVKSIAAPNALYGSMPVGGAAFLALMAPRFRHDGTLVTEAHPKVLYYAMTGRKHSWDADKGFMARWLLQELDLAPTPTVFGLADHPFDAALALLPALRGLNGDWPLDLHTLQNPKTGDRVTFAGPTHYWWPPVPPGSWESLPHPS